MRTPYYSESRGKWIAELPMVNRKRGEIKTFATKVDAERWLKAQGADAKLWGANGQIKDDDRTDYLRARDMAAKAGCTLTEAVEFWSVHSRHLEPTALSVAVPAFIKDRRESGCRKSHMRSLGWAVNNMMKFVGLDTEVHTISLNRIKEWADSRDWKLATRKRKLADISAFFAFCKLPGDNVHWVIRNPMDDMKPIHIDWERPKILTVDQCLELLTYTRTNYPRVIPFLVVQLFGGLRNCEAMKLTPEHFKGGSIDLEGQTVKRTRNSRYGRKVPVNDTLKAWLDLGSLEFHIRHHGHHEWKAIRDATKLPQNALRHTAATMTYELLGEHEASKRLGHSVSVLHTNYKGRLDDAGDVAKFWALVP